MNNRFMELFRSIGASGRRDVVAEDFEALRRANYARDDDERRAGTQFWRLAHQAAERTVNGPGLRLIPGGAPAGPEDRG